MRNDASRLPRRVLVTGGAGFIGSSLSARLLAENCELAIVDDLNDFYPPEEKIANLEGIGCHRHGCFYKADICNESAIRTIVARHQPQFVFHLAARAGVRPSIQEPLLYEQVNVQGTMILLEACRRLPHPPKFILASSSSVYGAASRLPFVEDDLQNLPVSPYAATKIAAEKMAFTYSHLYGIRAVCLRYFTVYGPRQRPDLAIRKFIECIDAGRTIPVYGDGSTLRDYTFVDDIVDGTVKAMQCDCSYDIFNLGNSRPVRLAELIETIEQAVGKTAKIKRLATQPGDAPATHADISKARRLLGYEPRTTLTDGIRQTVEWHRSRHDHGAIANTLCAGPPVATIRAHPWP